MMKILKKIKMTVIMTDLDNDGVDDTLFFNEMILLYPDFKKAYDRVIKLRIFSMIFSTVSILLSFCLYPVYKRWWREIVETELSLNILEETGLDNLVHQNVMNSYKTFLDAGAYTYMLISVVVILAIFSIISYAEKKHYFNKELDIKSLFIKHKKEMEEKNICIDC